MNPLVLKAGALAAAAMVLLVPTFNTLNTSHFDVKEPPFTLTPPPDVTPPPDYEPPPGEQELPDEEFEIPMGGACPETETKNRLAQRWEVGPGGSPLAPRGEESRIPIGGTDVRLVVSVNLSSYQGRLDLSLDSPSGARQSERVSDPIGSPGGGGRVIFDVTGPAHGNWTAAYDAQAFIGDAVIDVNVGYVVCKAPAEADA